MIRQRFVFAALLCSFLGGSQLWAANAWFSLNLEFNDPADFGSGGTWTVVAKADERGLAAALLALNQTSLNFDPATGFLTPVGFEVEESGNPGGLFLEILEGDLVFSPTIDVGVVGGTYPSSYVDDPNLIVFGSNPDLGSFSGGVPLATGSFDPGDIPAWYSSGPDSTAANVYLVPNPVNASPATVFTTVRYVGIPEPTSLLLAGAGMFVFANIRRK
jgi:hypothetical protein